MYFKSEQVEFRGAAEKQSKDNGTYYMVLFETPNYETREFYSKTVTPFESLSKGDCCNIVAVLGKTGKLYLEEVVKK